FADTVEALNFLKKSFKLVILSNVDRMSFSVTNRKLAVAFDAIYTAQDIGSYKPSSRNFTYLIERLAEIGHAKSDILHVAQSLFHDHAPARSLGIATAWIDRQGGRSGATPKAAKTIAKRSARRLRDTTKYHSRYQQARAHDRACRRWLWGYARPSPRAHGG
ncbi:MAG: hypothetical protein EXQ91_09375, partial [Alphaproteobacteria bacterium]|nr:hypothetical protein [Alphaproteobacteria bacterium]